MRRAGSEPPATALLVPSALVPQRIAMGLTGLLMARLIGSGAATNMQSYTDISAQSAASASVPALKISVYTRPSAGLIVVSNLGTTDFVGQVHVDVDALGMSTADVEFIDAEDAQGTVLPFQASAFDLAVPRHDLRLILARQVKAPPSEVRTVSLLVV